MDDDWGSESDEGGSTFSDKASEVSLEGEFYDEENEEEEGLLLARDLIYPD
jgi:hypothetical protein